MTREMAVLDRYRGKRVLLDANLLLLFLVGSYERGRIARFKRTAEFSADDFDTLSAVLLQFNTIVTTPHILTEVSNLSNSLPEHLKTSWWEHFQETVGRFLEVYQPAVHIMSADSFDPFGLTDAAIHSAAAETLVLTEDFRLSGFLHTQGIDALNFRHLVQAL